MPKVIYEFDYDIEQETEYYFRNGLPLFVAMQNFQSWLVNYLEGDFEGMNPADVHSQIVDNFNYQLSEEEVSLWR